MANIECSVPEELLRRKDEPFDEPTRFGVRTSYYLGDVRVAAYERAIPKVNTFETGATPLGFDPSGLELTYSVIDAPGEFQSIIESRVAGADAVLNRGVAIQIKAGQLAAMIQGTL